MTHHSIEDNAIRLAILLVLSLLIISRDVRADEDSATALSPAFLRETFSKEHDGWSLDEVMLSDTLRSKIVEAIRDAFPIIEEKYVWEELIRLRKSGKLQSNTTRREQTEYGDALVAAEIAARRMQDEQNVTFDQVLIDPVLLKQYDEYARAIDPDSDAYQLRKAALRLRKSRQLKPELVLRVTDWKRDFLTMSVEEAKKRIDSFPKRPGIYIFRDSTGFLYIGQSNNLRERLTKHLAESDRKNLSDYLLRNAADDLMLEIHVFREGSPAEQTTVREAYESELIRSRKPRLNLSP